MRNASILLPLSFVFNSSEILVGGLVCPFILFRICCGTQRNFSAQPCAEVSVERSPVSSPRFQLMGKAKSCCWPCSPARWVKVRISGYFGKPECGILPPTLYGPVKGVGYGMGNPPAGSSAARSCCLGIRLPHHFGMNERWGAATRIGKGLYVIAIRKNKLADYRAEASAVLAGRYFCF